MRQIALFLALILATLPAVRAQTGGQFCVKAFEDRNGNSVQDAGEPVLTRGLSINLLNAGGVVVQSAILENSTRAAFGEYCFQFLAAGQYSVTVGGAEFTATTPDTMTASVSETGAPVVMPFGGQRLAATSSAATGPLTAAQRQAQLEQVIVAVLGALLVVAMMVVVGVVVYLAAFRGRLRAAAAADARRTTGSMRAVRITDTGEFPEEDTPQI
jgi:threonine/homoserine/homoserine lactone efflux protein